MDGTHQAYHILPFNKTQKSTLKFIVLPQNYIEGLETLSLGEGSLQLIFCIKIGLFIMVQQQEEYEIQKWSSSCHAFCLSTDSL